MPDEVGKLSRRRLLATTVPTATTALAGCTGDGGSGAETSSPTDRATETTNTTDTGPTTTETETPERVPIARRIDRAAIDLDGTDPGLPVAAFEEIGPSIEDAAIVGLGESIFGTRELFDLHHRMVQYLVAERGIQLLGIEANFGAVARLSRYVDGGDIGIDEAFRRVTKPAYRREEVTALFEWLREYNADASPGSTVAVFGYGVRGHLASAAAVANYLRHVDEPFFRTNRDTIDDLVQTHLRVDDPDTRADRMQTMERAIDSIGSRFERREDDYVEGSSSEAYEMARRHLWVVERDVEQARARYATDESPTEVRQRAMADTVEWIRDRTVSDRMALLGHSHSIDKRAETDSGIRPLGNRLAESLDGPVATFTATAATGSFSAVPASGGSMRTYSLGEPTAGSIPAAFAGVDSTPFALDFAAIEDDRLRDWLATTRPGHDVGVNYDPSADGDAYAPVNLAEGFDGQFHVDEVTAATAIDRPE